MNEVNAVEILDSIGKADLEIRQIYDEDRTQYEADRDQAMGVLESHDYFSRDDKGRITFNIQKFQSETYFQFIKSRMGPIAIRPEYGGGKWIPTLFHTFKDIKGYSPEDYAKLETGEAIEPKSLFYTPRNKDAALSIEDIQNSSFYMGLWEVGEVPQLPKEYPTLDDGNQSGLATREAISSCLIYNPKYGDGKRDESGTLFVNLNSNEANGTQRKPISREFFRSWRYYGAPTSKEQKGLYKDGATIMDTPADFFVRSCPEMMKRDLIRPYEDFRIIGRADELGPKLKRPNDKGLVSINERRYNVGTEYKGKDGYRVYQLSDTIAAILLDSKQEDGVPQIVKVFKLNLEPLSEKEASRTIASRKIIGRSEITLYDPDEIDDLNIEEGVLVTNIKDFIGFSRRVAQEGNFSILDLSLKEKSLATKIYTQYKDDPRLWGFIKEYGSDGLRSLMAVEEANLHVESIWEMAEKVDVTKVFSDVSSIVKMIGAYQDSVNKQLIEEDQKHTNEVAHAVMSFTSKLLLSAVPVVRKDPNIQGVIDMGDVALSLRAFKKRVSEMYTEKFGTENDDTLYQKILSVYKGSSTNPNIDALALDMLRRTWLEQSEAEDSEVIQKVYAESDKFYSQNEELFESASETTGDTIQEIDHFKQYVISRELRGEKVGGRVLDMGCGDGKRITQPMAEILGNETSVIGIDRELPKVEPVGNMTFLAGDFTQIPLRDDSIDLATAHWSVVNDLASRKLQMDSFAELARVLKVGGEFYFDVPHLEGGEGSWEEAAKEYHKLHPKEPYGMINATFPGGRSKGFYIYPEKELQAMLENAGFFLIQQDDWRTESGKPRKTIVARLERKITPSRLAA